MVSDFTPMNGCTYDVRSALASGISTVLAAAAALPERDGLVPILRGFHHFPEPGKRLLMPD